MSQEVADFLNSLLDPEMFGYAVTQEVRARAKELLVKAGKLEK